MVMLFQKCALMMLLCVTLASGSSDCLVPGGVCSDALQDGTEALHLLQATARLHQLQGLGASSDSVGDDEPELEVPDGCEAISDAEDKVKEIATTVNTTLGDVMGQVGPAVEALTEICEKAKSTAESTNMIIGEDTVKIITKLADAVAAAVSKLSEQLESGTTKLQAGVLKVLTENSDALAKLAASFQDAIEQVTALQESALNQVEAKVSSHHGAKADPCAQANAQIEAANKTIAVYSDQLAKMNATSMMGVIDDAKSVVLDGISKVNATVMGALDVGVDLPSAVTSPITDAFASILAVADDMEEKVAEVKTQVSEKFAAAQEAILALYSKASGLVDDATKVCNVEKKE